MKILMVSWFIYDERISIFHNNHCTGGDLLIRNIAVWLSKKENVYLFLGKKKLPATELGDIHIVKTDYNFDDIDFYASNESRLLHFEKCFEIAVNEIKPDIVHIHDYGDMAFRLAIICKKNNIVLVNTNHLYTGHQYPGCGYEEAQEWADRFYSVVTENIIAVSSATKSKLLYDYPQLTDESVTVILNGTDFIAEIKQSDILDRYSLNGYKVLLCVGTIFERKNQLQVVRAYKLLPEEVKNRVKIIFIGVGPMEEQLKNEISKNGLDDALMCVGAVDNSKIKEFYSIARGIIMPSLSEGLSIVMMEAMSYGLPIISFSDLEGVSDISDCKITSEASERTDVALTEAIVNWFYKKWDYDYIKTISRSRFTLDRIADEYIDLYNRLIL